MSKAFSKQLKLFFAARLIIIFNRSVIIYKYRESEINGAMRL